MKTRNSYCGKNNNWQNPEVEHLVLQIKIIMWEYLYFLGKEYELRYYKRQKSNMSTGIMESKTVAQKVLQRLSYPYIMNLQRIK